MSSIKPQIKCISPLNLIVLRIQLQCIWSWKMIKILIVFTLIYLRLKSNAWVWVFFGGGVVILKTFLKIWLQKIKKKMTIQFQQLYLKVYKSVLIFTALFTMDWISTSIKNEKSQQRFLILKVNIYTFLYIYCWCKAKYVQSILTLVSFFFQL